MTEQSPGLRFDIYERVHLSEEVDGIESLETVELTPHIELYTEEETAILRGHLLLAGEFSSQLRQQNVAFEHRIPVEISMPVERMERTEAVGVEIEHFDVDLTQGGGLNVTGVLTLRGLKSTTPVMENWNQGEELLFVHNDAQPARGQEQADALRQTDEATYQVESFTPAAAQESPDVVVEEYVVQSYEPPAVRQSEGVNEVPQDPLWQVEQVQDNAEAEVRTAASEVESVQAEVPAEIISDVVVQEPRSVQASVDATVDAGEAEEPIVSEQTDSREDTVEAGSQMKVAISGKPADDNAFAATNTLQGQLLAQGASQREPAAAEPVSSQPVEAVQQEQVQIEVSEPDLQATGERFDQPTSTTVRSESVANVDDPVSGEAVTDDAARQVSAQAAESSQSGGGVAWKNLFLSRENSETRFSKLKMCIVQKEETLDTIADRYKLNPREIILYNRLTEQEVSEGQIIYIPLSS